jgi:predicted metalloprotease
MLWKRARRSDNVVDDSGGGSGMLPGGGRLGLGGLALIVVIGLLSGKDPLQILSQIGGQLQQQASPPGGQPAPARPDGEQREFVRAVLGDTEDTWHSLFQARGRQYQDPQLVLFNGGVRSACGFASAAVGPFYCPADQRVYLDLDFFRELEQRFAAAGDFARAYVIAHEVGHHVQNLLGIPAKVEAARRRGVPMEGPSGLSVRQELQADCLAGVWAHQAQRRLNWLEPGDLEEALNAANAIGDDHLQRQARGRVMPDTFTHGTSTQRVRWFRLGFDSGQPDRCNTFKKAAQL